MISDRFPELKIVLLGTTEEKHLGGIDGSPTFPAQVLDLRGKTALLDIPVIINSARLVIGNETGPIHLAIALGIPSVAIVGGGHPDVPVVARSISNRPPELKDWAPTIAAVLDLELHCSRKVPECIIDVPVSQVWKELVNMLERMGMPCA